jgi:polyphosphate glucokinase
VTLVNDADAAGIAEMRFGAGVGRHGVVILLTLGTGIGSAIFCDGVLLPNTELGQLKIRGKDIEHRASERIRKIKDMPFKKWAGIVGEFLEELEKLFSPELFLIAGGISKKADKFLPYLKAKSQVPIEVAKMQNDAGIIGAATLAKIRS